jgi:hypothetical protein
MNVIRESNRLLRGTYQRVSQKLLKGTTRPKKSARVINGLWVTVYASTHRTPQARKWATFWRIKNRRIGVTP